jgi:hypothetical protein
MKVVLVGKLLSDKSPLAASCVSASQVIFKYLISKFKIIPSFPHYHSGKVYTFRDAPPCEITIRHEVTSQRAISPHHRCDSPK